MELHRRAIRLSSIDWHFQSQHNSVAWSTYQDHLRKRSRPDSQHSIVTSVLLTILAYSYLARSVLRMSVHHRRTPSRRLGASPASAREHPVRS